MRKDSWEWKWYQGHTSPMERVVIHCGECEEKVMPYHSLLWRDLTYSDFSYMKMTNFRYVGICHGCFDEQQQERREDEKKER